MSGIFGLVNFDGAPVAPGDLSSMRAAMAHWGPDGVQVWSDGVAGLGHCLLAATPEACGERWPRAGDGGAALTIAGRVDNRDDLLEALDVPHPERAGTPDGDLIGRAYAKWGKAAAAHVLGDWSFAAWHRGERTLFLARDHYGISSLYYFRDARRFAFASDRRALLALPYVPRQIDELYCAQILVAWQAYQGPRTAYAQIQRVPPAHAVSVTDGGVHVSQYWRLEETPPAAWRSAAESRDALLESLQTAVAARLRSRRPVGTMLSAGLDSGTVAVLAAERLTSEGRPLTALTATPLFDVDARPGALANEWPLAAMALRRFRGVDHVPIRSEGVGPVAGFRRMVAIHGEFQQGAANQYWMCALLAEARRRDLGVVLTGKAGNGTISRLGAGPATPPGWPRVAHAVTSLGARVLPRPVGAPIRYRRRFGVWPDREAPWRPYSPLHPAMARRLRLRELMADAAHDPMLLARPSPRQLRHEALLPGRSIAGALMAEYGAAFGLEVRDPTADVRVLTTSYSIPEPHWDGPMARWLCREMMAGRLPDAVRLNRRRGLQRNDLIPRLAAWPDERRAAWDEVSGRHIEEAGLLDLEYMRTCEQLVTASLHGPPDPHRIERVAWVLVRGLAAAAFLASH